VLGVGGTSLTANPVTGAYLSETAWNTPAGGKGGQSQASGGGFSHLFARPAYQDGVPGIGTWRGVPDVAADASPVTNMAVARCAPGGTCMLTPASGTSAGGPFWAGLIALADQEAGHPLGFVNPAIYRIARGPLYHKAFHDITTGTNTMTLTSPPVAITGYRAGTGWDPVTGWGTPTPRSSSPARPLSGHPGGVGWTDRVGRFGYTSNSGRRARMDPIALIMAALAAGACAGAIDSLKDNAEDAAKAAYRKLRGLARKRVAGRPDGELALDRYEAAPQKWEAVLADELTESDAGSDQELIRAAQQLMALLDTAGSRTGKYVVSISGSRGVQVGDHNLQTNTFGPPPSSH